MSSNLSTSKTLDTVVDDIYKKLKPLDLFQPLELSDEDIDRTTEDFKQAIISWARPSKHNVGFSVRMSNIGRPARQLWYEKQSVIQDSNFEPSNHIRFLYGHVLEAIVLMLVRLAGHAVTDEQKEVSVNGIKGHIDCKINGEIVDVKSASGFGFRKFQAGDIAKDDPFGYLAQLASYEASEGTENGGFLVISKESGELCFYRPEDMEKPNAHMLIDNLKKDLDKDTPPPFCAEPVPEGTKGNMKLARICTYCKFKFDCHKDSNNGTGLRTFKYSKGPIHLTTVKALPKVAEL